MEVQCDQRLIPVNHDYQTNHYPQNSTNMICSVNGVGELNQDRFQSKAAPWSTYTKPAQICHTETGNYVNPQSNQMNHHSAIKFYPDSQNLNNPDLNQVSTPDYNPGGFYYYRNADNKDWWSSSTANFNPDTQCQQTQSFGYSCHEYQPSHQNNHQQPTSLHHYQQHHENIQFSDYHRNYYYESHYEHRYSYQANNSTEHVVEDHLEQTANDQKNNQSISRLEQQISGSLRQNPELASHISTTWLYNSNIQGIDPQDTTSSNFTSNVPTTPEAQIRLPSSNIALPTTIKHEPQPAQSTRLKLSNHNAVSEDQSKVATHTAAAAAAQRTNQCRVCGRNYARPSTLKTHLRTHTNERPFKCNVCLKTFSQAANLTAHQRVHTGERPFSCPICDRQFSQSSSVITHLRTHSATDIHKESDLTSGERPYRCNLCSRTFSDSSTLTKHCRIHSGEKPYQCDHCPLNFSQSGNLSRHLRLHQINSARSSTASSPTASRLRHSQQVQQQKQGQSRHEPSEAMIQLA